MGVDKTLAEVGVELNEFNKPVGSPTKKLFAQLVSNMRKIEKACDDAVSDKADQLAQTQHLLMEANERIRLLEVELHKHQVKKEARRLDLPESEAKRLIDAATRVESVA